MEQANEPKFKAPVSYGKGAYLSARRGTLTIDEAELTLCNRDVAEAEGAHIGKPE